MGRRLRRYNGRDIKIVEGSETGKDTRTKRDIKRYIRACDCALAGAAVLAAGAFFFGAVLIAVANEEEHFPETKSIHN